MTEYTRIDQAAAAACLIRAELKLHNEAAAKRSAALQKDLDVARAAVRVAASGGDLQKVALAESVLEVRGTYARAGEERAISPSPQHRV